MCGGERLREEPPLHQPGIRAGCSPLLSSTREEQPDLGRERAKTGPGGNPQPLSSEGKAWAENSQGEILQELCPKRALPGGVLLVGTG